jgi:hypothetical protein
MEQGSPYFIPRVQNIFERKIVNPWNKGDRPLVKGVKINNPKPNRMKIRKFAVLGIAALAIAGFSSCNKENGDNDTFASEDEAFSTMIIDEIQTIADDAMFGDVNLRIADGNQTLAGPCATKTLDTTVTPRVLTIDFGAVNCLCSDGRYRRGKLITTFTGHYRDSGTVITHSTQNYFVNDNEVINNSVVTNMGHNSNGNLFYTIVANGTIIMALSGDTITHSSNRQREWILGANTPQRQDDVYLITGTSSVSNSNGHGATSTITNALRRELNCNGL